MIISFFIYFMVSGKPVAGMSCAPGQQQVTIWEQAFRLSSQIYWPLLLYEHKY